MDEDKWESTVIITGKEDDVVKALDKIKDINDVEIHVGVMYDVAE